MTISSKLLGIGTAVVILLAIIILMITGLWSEEEEKTPAKFTSGQFAGVSDPSDIRGSYTFADIEEFFNVPSATIARAFGLDTSDAGSHQANSLEAFYGELENGEVGTDSIKWFVALYNGLPFEPEETSLLPRTAIQMLQDEQKIDQTILQQLEARAISIAIDQDIVIEEHESEELAYMIKGNTTYGDIISWGLSQEEVESLLGYPITDRGAKLRDDLAAKGLEFSTYKNLLEDALNN